MIYEDIAIETSIPIAEGGSSSANESYIIVAN